MTKRQASSQRKQTEQPLTVSEHWRMAAVIVFTEGEFEMGAAFMVPPRKEDPAVPAFGSAAVH